MKTKKIIIVDYLLTNTQKTYTPEEFTQWAQDIWSEDETEDGPEPYSFQQAIVFITNVAKDVRITFETREEKESDDLYYPNIEITLERDGNIISQGMIRPEERDNLLKSFWEHLDICQMKLAALDGDIITYNKQRKPEKKSQPKPESKIFSKAR